MSKNDKVEQPRCKTAFPLYVPVEIEVWKQCYPEFMKKYSGFAIINCFLVLTIGGLGNILNLLAIPYVFFKYPHKFEKRWNQTTLLMLHLSYCDLAYVVVGMPFFLNIYINNQITFSNTVCWLVALVRNWIAYADFLTLGIIAYVRMRANFYRPPHGFNLFKCFLQCCSTWVLSFLIISPIVSEGDWFGIHWGKFGPAPNVAMCNTYSCPTGLPYSPSALVYTVGFFLPFFTILIAYLLVLPIKMKRIQYEQDEFVDTCEVNKALWMLFLAYFIFSGPLTAIEWLGVTNISDESLAIATIIGYNWYFWIYAINFIVYLASLEDFREMYKIFLQDCIHFMCKSKKRETKSTRAVVYTVSGRVNLGFETPLERRTSNGDFEMNREADIEFRLVRSSSAPPCKRKRRFTENPRSASNWNGKKSSEPESDYEDSFVRNRFAQNHQIKRTTKTSNLNTSWTSITNSTQGRMMETPTLLTTTVTAEHGRRLLASAALKMALDLDKIE